MNKVYHGFSHSSGVYKITNIENGDVYFGQAVQLATRAMQHEKALVKNKHKNPHLQAAWNKYKSDAFEFEVIAVYPERTERDAAEQALIDEHYGPGCYNIMKKVSTVAGTWSHTPEETRAKLRASNIGVKRSPETCAAISAAKKGKKHSPEHCAAISDANIGKKRKPFTPEHRASMAAAKKGKKHSPETCAAMSAARQGKLKPPRTKEHRAAISATWARKRLAKILIKTKDE